MGLGLGLGLLNLAGCGDGPGGGQAELVATVAGEGQQLSLDRRVVESIMARDGLSEDQARDRGLATLRLVAARRAELAAQDQPPANPDDLDPARRVHLERAALVRLWLDEVFEAKHATADIPAKVVAQNLATPSLSRRLFHPELYFVCQILLVPAATGEDGRNLEPPSEPEAAAAWRAAASEVFAPLVARTRWLEPELVGGPESSSEAGGDCAVLGRVIGVSRRTFDLPRVETPSGETLEGAVTVRFERFAFAPSDAGSFDPQWVEAVSAAHEPSLVGPFPTRFGLHLVVIDKIEPASLADGSMAPAELAEARDAKLRAEILEAWQAEQLGLTLADARDRRIVRLAPELEGSP